MFEKSSFIQTSKEKQQKHNLHKALNLLHLLEDRSFASYFFQSRHFNLENQTLFKLITHLI